LIYSIKIPFDQGHIYHQLKENNTILETRFEDDGTFVKTILTPDQAIMYQSLIINKSAS
jgi:GTP-binding protein HflX